MLGGRQVHGSVGDIGNSFSVGTKERRTLCPPHGQ